MQNIPESEEALTSEIASRLFDIEKLIAPLGATDAVLFIYNPETGFASLLGAYEGMKQAKEVTHMIEKAARELREHLESSIQ